MKYFNNYNKFNNCGCGCEDCEDTKHYIIKESVKVSDNLQYHVDNNIVILENIFRYGSENYFNTINELRSLYESKQIDLSEHNKFFINTDLGKKELFEEKEVWLDFPYLYEPDSINEAEYKGKDVQLNKPKRGGSKKYYVYVKNDKGNVIKVSFGAKSGGGKLAVKLKDPKARKAFADRHDCKNKKDRTKAGYWSCNLPRYADSLGLGGGGNYYW